MLPEAAARAGVSLLRRHPDGPVDADRLAVEHGVGDDVGGQGGEVRGVAQAREHHLVDIDQYEVWTSAEGVAKRLTATDGLQASLEFEPGRLASITVPTVTP